MKLPSVISHSVAAFFRHGPILAVGSIFSLTLFLSLALLTMPVWAQEAPQEPAIEILSSEDTTCYYLTWKDEEVNPVFNAYKAITVAVTLPYTGIIEEATLLLRSANVRSAGLHPILINGVDTGYTPPHDDYPTCDAPRPPIQEYPLDLSKTPVHPGVNTIHLDTAGATDIWGADYIAIRVKGHDLKGGHFESIVFPGENGQNVKAELLLPNNLQDNSPLLMLFHGWRGTPNETFFTDYTPAAIENGWIIVSPQQRGQNLLGAGGQPLASRRSQHDAIKLLDYMQTHYHTDPARVYVGGFSMGGMMAGVLAAKYPDRFAAVVTHMAITDLRDWYYEAGEYRQAQIITETGGTPQEVPFEYDRRSPKELASNLSNTPIAVIHGISDTVVAPRHAQDFYDAIQAAIPTHAELHWYSGGHEPAQTPPFGGVWAADFMKAYRLNSNPTHLRLVTDESKSYYWLTIASPKVEPWRNFTRVDVDVHAAEERILATVDDVLPVTLRFDLRQMGLDARVSYVISQTNQYEGSNITAVTPLDGQLNVVVPKGETQLELFPNRGNMPVAITLQRGKDGYDGVIDSYLYAWAPDSNYGSSTNVTLRPGAVQRGLMRFELENLLPDNIRITSANLYLYDNASGPNMTVNLHHLTRAWNENEVTYNQAAAGEAWTHPGGDFAPDVAATLQLDSSSARYVNVSVLDSVQAWVAHPAENHGWLLDVSQAGYNSSRSVQASDFWDANRRPKLKIIYQPIPYGKVHGVVYNDRNRNRQHDDGEPLLAGAQVILQQNGKEVARKTTGPDGSYQFERLDSGSYQLLELAPTGYGPARPASNTFFSVAAGDDLSFDFAHDPPLYLPLQWH